MLAYAANLPKTAGRNRSPEALTLIIAGHALVLAAVLTAKPELIDPMVPARMTMFDVTDPPPPPPPMRNTDPRPATQHRFIATERPIVDMEQPTSIALSTSPSFEDIGTVIGSGPTTVLDPPRNVPLRLAARMITSDSALKPPYPLDKMRSEEEATLRLRLTIGANGRVIAVDPIGAADPSFLEAARRHILKAWRYKPATEDGMAVQSTALISLSFRLEDV